MPLVGRSVTPRSKVLHNMRMPLVGRSAKPRSIVLHKKMPLVGRSVKPRSIVLHKSRSIVLHSGKMPLVGRSVKPRSIVLHKSRSIVLHSGKVPEGRSARPRSRKLHSMKMPVSRPHGPALFSGVGSLAHGWVPALGACGMRDRSDRQDGRSGRPWDPAGRQSKTRMRVGKRGVHLLMGTVRGRFPQYQRPCRPTASLAPRSPPVCAAQCTRLLATPALAPVVTRPTISRLALLRTRQYWIPIGP